MRQTGDYLRRPEPPAGHDRELGLVEGSRLRGAESGRPARRTRVLILGVNGFIGNHLSERLLQDDRYEV